MTYAEKLRTPQWFRFKQEFLEWRDHVKEIPPHWCDNCGDEYQGALELHHTVYRKGCEPCEYELEEMRLYCGWCHSKIHYMEERLRSFIRTVNPHECDELEQMLNCLIEAQNHGLLKVAGAHCKNTVMSLLQMREANRSDTAKLIEEAFRNLVK